MERHKNWRKVTQMTSLPLLILYLYVSVLIHSISLCEGYKLSCMHPRSAVACLSGCTKQRSQRSIALHAVGVHSSLPVNEDKKDRDNDKGVDELELQMQQETYDDLRGDSPILTKEQFVAWEDIRDLIDADVFDRSTVEVIFEEIGIKDELIPFSRFAELVDMVNQLAALLDEDIYSDEGEGLDIDVDGFMPGIDGGLKGRFEL